MNLDQLIPDILELVSLYGNPHALSLTCRAIYDAIGNLPWTRHYDYRSPAAAAVLARSEIYKFRPYEREVYQYILNVDAPKSIPVAALPELAVAAELVIMCGNTEAGKRAGRALVLCDEEFGCMGSDEILAVADRIIYAATSCKNGYIVEYMIGNSYIGDTDEPFVEAARVGAFGICMMLFNLGANIAHNNYQALINACANGHFDIAKLLVNEGSSPLARCCAPIKGALSGRHYDIVKLLIGNLDCTWPFYMDNCNLMRAYYRDRCADIGIFMSDRIYRQWREDHLDWALKHDRVGDYWKFLIANGAPLNISHILDRVQWEIGKRSYEMLRHMFAAAPDLAREAIAEVQKKRWRRAVFVMTDILKYYGGVDIHI